MSTDQSPETEDRPGGAPRRRQLTVIGVAAAVLLAGGGGAYWASSASDSADEAGAQAGSQKPPQLSLDRAALSARGGQDIAPGKPLGPRSYRATSELPAGPDSAAAHKASRPAGKGELRRLAKSLGIKGSPEKKSGRWEVAPEDGKGAVLASETGDRSGMWMYTDRGALTGECDRSGPQKPDARHRDLPGTPVGSGACKRSSSTELPQGEPVSEDTAKAAVRPVLKTLGLEGAQIEAGPTLRGARTVIATPEVDGLPTYGWDSTFMIDSKGRIARANGSWGQTAKGADYPVQSADATLDELNKRSQKRGSSVVSSDGKGEKQQPAKVKGATFGLSLEHAHGKRMLVPSWIYDVKQGSGGSGVKVAHPAVDPEFVKFSRATSGEGGPGIGLPSPARPPRSSPGEKPGSAPSAPAPGGGSGGSSSSSEIGAGGEAPSQAAESYKAEGRTLKISFWGGVCDTYKATAEESGTAVKVRVRAEPSDEKKVCVKIAKRQTVEVKLDKPLGERKVLDARDGDALPRK